ncbi:hypothetical protein C8R43DRAFT_903091 [Mycena crocata]|nr:hypothetical protein C8R43DRAFT_903091 [Mycena crocata]
MAPFVAPLAAFLLFTPLLVSAAPSFAYADNIAGLPRNAKHLALDEDTGEIIAFSRRGNVLGRFPVAKRNVAIGRTETIAQRDTGSCANMQSEDVQKLPGWKTLKAEAEKNWGTKSYNVVTNDNDFSDYPAQICTSTDIVEIVPDGKPSAAQNCHTQHSISNGTEVGTNGTVTLTHTQGTSSETTTTVTKEASVSVGVSVAATIGFPAIADVTTTFTFTGTFTNSLSKAQKTTNDETSSATVTQQTSAGKVCHLEFTTQKCTVTGTGKVLMLASGWVWFEYKSKVKDHYKCTFFPWALNIESTITNQDDRSESINFKTTTDTTSTSEYKGVCT